MKVFLDTDILVSGIFFSSNESRLLSFPNVELFTSDITLEELKEVVSRKFASLKTESRRIAFQEIYKATGDIHIVSERISAKYLSEAATLVKGENDKKILAAVLYIKPDFFVTGDHHFHTAEVKKRVNTRRDLGTFVQSVLGRNSPLSRACEVQQEAFSGHRHCTCCHYYPLSLPLSQTLLLGPLRKLPQQVISGNFK